MRPTLSRRTAVCFLFRNPAVRPASRLVIFLASFCASPKPDGSWILSSLACEMEFRISQAEVREIYGIFQQAAYFTGLTSVVRPLVSAFPFQLSEFQLSALVFRFLLSLAREVCPYFTGLLHRATSLGCFSIFLFCDDPLLHQQRRVATIDAIRLQVIRRR
jgi:hypothetical protein